MSASRHNQSEIAKAEVMLQGLKAKLNQIRAHKAEQTAEMQELDLRHHVLQATGDINRMIAVKNRSMSLKKAVAALNTAETECLQRIQSVERYLETLNRKLDGLRKEANSVAEKLNDQGLAGDVIAGLQTAGRRIKMQIDALVGQE
jgi:chromosome segregation ATPase